MSESLAAASGPSVPDLPRLAPEAGRTLGESVRDVLARRLIAGEYAPGDKLSLRSVAEALGVSTAPARAAVERLVAEGALEVTPKRAVRVPVLDVARFRELTLLRIDIEGAAAERAALARDPADIAAIDGFEREFRAESEKRRPDLARAVALNQKLHFAIYGAAKSSMLIDVISGLWLKAGPILNLDMRSSIERLRNGHGRSVHAKAAAAIRDRDGPAARAAIAEDIQGASDFIIARGILPGSA